LLAPSRGALNLWNKLFGVDNLIDFETTHIASINSDLNARLNITASGDYSLHIDEGADLLSLDITHSLNVLLCLLSMNNENLVLSLQLRWKLHLNIRYLTIKRVGRALHRLLEIELALVHQNLEGAQLILAEIHCGLGHILINGS